MSKKVFDSLQVVRLLEMAVMRVLALMMMQRSLMLPWRLPLMHLSNTSVHQQNWISVLYVSAFCDQR